MNTITKHHALLSVLLASATLAIAQADRGVYMLHGYPGNQGSLEVGANYLRREGSMPTTPTPRFPQIVHVGVVDYPNGDGVLVDARRVAATIDGARRTVDPDMANERTIAFGSSYGGLVARQIAINEIGREPARLTFGGVITHGTPNTGAPIAANIDDVSEWGEDMAATMVEPFIMEGASSIPILGDIPEFRIAARLTEGPFRRLATLTPGTVRFTSGLIGGAVDLFIDWQASRQSRIDMVPGSAVLRGFEAADDALDVQRQLTFAVEEEEDLIYRMLSGPVQATPAIVGDFGGNEDLLVEPLIGLEALMATRRELWAQRVADRGVIARVDGEFRTRLRMRAIRDAYGDANEALVSADGRYKELGGFFARRFTGRITPGQCVCIEAGDGNDRTVLVGVTNRADCETDTPDEELECWNPIWIPPTAEFETVYVPNDGIVPVASQQAFTEDFQVGMPGDNHFSSNNSAEYRNALNTIFDGRSNPWFECD